MPLILDQLEASGFRCFGPEGIVITLEALSCFIGPNGAGKTAALTALRRMFGVEAGERRVRPEDFFLKDGELLSDSRERELRLEARFQIETEDGADVTDAAEAAGFDHMVVEEPGGARFLRIELFSTWQDDGTLEGEVEQQLSWITTAATDAAEIEEARKKMSGADRALIRAVYVSATRDPASEVRAIAGTGLGRLIRAAVWSDDLSTMLIDQSDEMETQLGSEQALAVIRGAIEGRWPELYRGGRYAKASLAGPVGELRDLVAGLRPSLSDGKDGEESGVDVLSDGFKSLFSLAFTTALMDVENGIRSGEAKGFDGDAVALPVLTLLLVEEPENHISPHHLGRVVKQLKAISSSEFSQAILTSHSPSVVRRVDPAAIRYFCGGEQVNDVAVHSLTLPDDTEEAGKYVRQAVRAHPELYFSRLVILGEGASEEIVIPRLLAASGIELDSEQVSVVPLGGRHVNHFWRLLDDLGVEYITLLDLDRCRTGGGWARVKYVIEQLIALGVSRKALLAVTDGHGNEAVLEEDEFAKLSKRDDTDEELDAWVDDLMHYNVFFTAPLDIDQVMLWAFPDEYKAVSLSQPRVPKDPQEKTEYRKRAALAVLGEEGTPEYYKGNLRYFAWYRALFIHGSKPGAHMAVLSTIESDTLLKRCPKPLKALIDSCKQKLDHGAPASSDEAT
ncbi:MAG: DUF2813 domain-containing protein [Planctomycetes bacterium]|nr:DUF2813 domain-containing protein [Planctomycetota bacterium]NOG53334.1 AAA family ATPase [Planctomycetota bacterium]